MLRVEVLGFRVWGEGFRVSGFGFRVSGFGFRVKDFGFRVSGFGRRIRVEGSVFSVECSGFRVRGLGIRCSGLGFGVQGLDGRVDLVDIVAGAEVVLPRRRRRPCTLNESRPENWVVRPTVLPTVDRRGLGGGLRKLWVVTRPKSCSRAVGGGPAH